MDADGHWSYQLDNTNASVQALGAGQTLSDSFTVTSQDGSASQLVSITIAGSNDVAVVSGTVVGAVAEDGVLSATGTVVVTDADAGQGHTLVASNVASTYGHWSVDGDGHWSYQLDNANSAVQALGAGQTLIDSFALASQDGSASKTVNITITGTNDVAVISGTVTGAVTEDGVLSATGTVVVTDADAGQAHTLVASNVASTYGHWSVDADGHWSYQLDNANAAVQALGAGQTLGDSFTVVSQDGSASQQVSITIAGTNDIAVISGTVAGNVIEDGIGLATGTLAIVDGDAGQNHSLPVANASSSYGSWSADGDGHWAYQLDNSKVQGLAAGAMATDSFVINSLDGSASKTISISITGSNDVPTITGNASGTVTEDSSPVAAGSVLVTDADSTESHTAIVSGDVTTYGAWSVDADGHWQYQLDNSKVQYLAAGETATDSFIIESQDGSASKTVTITIIGSSDAPTTPIDSDGALNTIASNAVAGSLVGLTILATDMDGDNLTYSLSNNAGGRFQVDPQTGIVSVAAGATLAVGTYTVTAVASDGLAQSTPQNFTITVGGANQAPVLSPVIAAAFTAATFDGWGVWVAQDGGQPIRVANFSTFPQFLTQLGSKLYFTGSDTQHGNELWCYDLVTGLTNMTADIWTGTTSSNPQSLAVLGGKLYFTAYDAAHGAELWVHDPATQATTLAADILVGSGNSTPQYLTVVGGKLYFEAYEATKGGELWVYDPATKQASLVADIYPGSIGSYPKFLTEAGGKLVFNATDGSHGNELWVFDPATKAMTQFDMWSGSPGSYPQDLVNIGGKVYFNGTDNGNSREIWVYDPATNTVSVGTHMTATYGSFYPGKLAGLDGKLYFSGFAGADGVKIWCYDPATKLTGLVANLLTPSGVSMSPSFLQGIGGKLYISADDGVHGREAWVYDPATGQSSMLSDLVPASHAQELDQGIEISGKLYFTAVDAAHGPELWVYDPATNTANLAVEVWPGAGGVSPNFQAVIGGRLYFNASDGNSGNELWVFDPATQAASLAADIRIGSAGSAPQFITAVAGKVYFSADDGSHGAELWVFDPVTKTSNIVLDIATGLVASNPQNLTEMGGKLYFSASDGSHGSQLWVFDPATQVATMATNMGTISLMSPGANPQSLTPLGGKLYFSADDGVHGPELWVYDPVTQAASLAADINAGGNGSYPAALATLNGKLYFSALDGTHGSELWVYDPVTQAANMIVDLLPGGDSAYPMHMIALSGKLYFSATDATHGNELWVYDPVTNSAHIAADLVPGSSSSAPSYLSVTGGKLLISAFDSTGAGQLWVYDPATQQATLANVTSTSSNSSNPQQFTSVVDETLHLLPIPQDASVNAGTSVATLLGHHASDADANTQIGIAVIGADTTHGSWQYTLDHGAHWLTLGAVSDHNATTLADTAELRFVAAAGFTGSADLTIRAWDQSDHHHSGDSGVDASIGGGGSAFSSIVHAGISVTAAQLDGLTLNGGAGDDALAGGKPADTIHGNAGNDVIMGNGGADHLFGDAGNDKIHVADAAYAEVHGGSGMDTLFFDGGNLVIDLHQLAGHTDGIDRIDVTGGLNDTVSLKAADVLSLSDNGTLAIFGSAGNAVHTSGEGWHAAGTQVVDGHACNVFTATLGAQTATLLVDQHIADQQVS